jgi:hypothetical protein
MKTPINMTIQVAAWNNPSHRMLSAIASIVTGGTTAEPSDATARSGVARYRPRSL